MLTTQETQDELSKDIEKLYSKPGKGKKDQEYLRHGAVALAMNKAFTQIGWDCVTERFDVIKPAFRCNSGGKADEAGTYFTAIASAVVTVKARSIFRGDGTFVEVVRTCAGVGQAVGGKSITEFDAIQNAITSAETAAFKRACRYFGPSTGLTLQFDPGEREAIQNQIEQANQAEKIESGGAATIEGVTTSDDMSPPADPAPVASVIVPPVAAPVVKSQVAAPAAPAAPAPVQTNGNGVGHGIPEVLKNLQDQTVLNRISALVSDEDVVPSEDVKALQMALIGTFEKHGGIGLWKTAGLALGPNSIIKKSCLNSISQVLEEASIGPGGLEGFFARFVSKPAAEPQKQPEVSQATATIIMDGKHVAGPAPTVPAPGKTQVEPSVQADPTDPSARMTMGEQMQEIWDESELGKADRRERYKRFGGLSPEIVELLVATPDSTEITREAAAKVHAVGLARYAKLNQPSDVMEVWKKAGFAFGNGQPRGKHVRAFVNGLPD